MGKKKEKFKLTFNKEDHDQFMKGLVNRKKREIKKRKEKSHEY